MSVSAGNGANTVGPRCCHQSVSNPFSWLSIPQVLGVPAGERVGVTGAEEHAADAGDSLHELLRWRDRWSWPMGAPAVILSVIPPRVTPQDRTVSAGRHTGPDLEGRHWGGRHRRLGSDSYLEVVGFDSDFGLLTELQDLEHRRQSGVVGWGVAVPASGLDRPGP